MKPHIFPVILSGGAGSRLWPLSTCARPKQYHRLTGADTMLAETLGRVRNVEGVQSEACWIICGEPHAAMAQETLSRTGIEGGRVICEPSGRNTAPAAALACALALQDDPEALVLILPSDHHIGNRAAFHEAIVKGARHAADRRLVAFGIRPSRPETGYGYIQRGAAQGDGYDIARFVEKPELAKAEAMLVSGDFDWNAGIFLFHAQTFLDELKRLRPDMHDETLRSIPGEANGPVVTPTAEVWNRIPSDSIDYAVMQETDRGRVVPVDMSWSDVGSFATLWEMSDKDERGNALTGDVIEVGGKNNYVSATGGRVIALVGCEDMVVIETERGVLVMPRDKAQDVKKVVEHLKQAGRKADL